MIAAFSIAIIAVILAFLGRYERKHNYWVFFAFVLLTAFLSLGYYWGNDVSTYEDRFEYYTNAGISLFDFTEYGLLALKEPGFVFINVLCEPIGYWGMRAILFIIENAIIFFFVINHVDRKWYWLAVYIYCFNPYFWALSSSMMRQWLAICIIVLAVDFLLRKKKVVFVLLVLLASTIHISSLVCLVFLPLYYLQKNSTKGYLILYILVLFIYFILSPLFISSLADFLTHEDLYLGYTFHQGKVGISALGRMAIFIILLYAALRINAKDKLINWIVLLYGFVLPLLNYGELSSRIGFYFTIFTIVAYPSFMNNSKINTQIKTVIIGMVCVYLLYMFFTFFTGMTYSESYNNYRMIKF